MTFRNDHAIRRRASCLVAVGCCVALLAGCDSGSNSDDDDSIAGTWVATLDASGTTFDFEMTLSETDDVVGGKSILGSGSVASSARGATFEISGSYVHPFLSLNADYDVPPGADPFGTISGQVNTDRTEIIATVSGPIISGQTLFVLDD